MDTLEIAKIENTIKEIQNLLSKDFVDPSNSAVLMTRAVHQLQQLMTRIGYLETKLDSTIEGNLLVSELLQEYIRQFGHQFVD